MLDWQIPEFQKEGKSYLSIAIGCTGDDTVRSRSPRSCAVD